MPATKQQAEIRIELEKVVLRLRAGGKLTPEELTRITHGLNLDRQAGKNIMTPELELERYYGTHFDAAMKQAEIPYLLPAAQSYMRQPSRVGKAALIQEISK
jgi:CBS domain containing-hemolysin-like protein